MIDFTYNEEKNSYRVQLNSPTPFSKEDLPLKVNFRTIVDNNLIWESELMENHWTIWNGGDHRYNTFVYTNRGNLVFEKPFNVEIDGSYIEKTLHYFIKGLPYKPRGMVIGPHNGTFGHWVYDMLADNSDVVFVEGTNDHLEVLKKNYKHLTSAKFLNEIVTPDGKPVEWYEGDQGYTNTVRPFVIKKYLKDDQITTEVRNSISINDLFKREMDVSKMGPAFDWLHLDVEGLDCELILSLEYEPSLIIFESRHATRRNYFAVLDWMQERDYRLYNDGLDAVCIKNNYFNPYYEEDLRD